MVQLSLEELKNVLKLLKDKKRKKRKNKGNKKKRLTTTDGYNMGGLKSDSRQMQGYSLSMPFSNTANQQTEILALQKNLLENQLKNPERFNKPEAPNNLLTVEDFKKSMGIFGSQLGNYYDSRISLLEDKANQFATDLNYGKSDLIRNRENAAFIEQLPDENDENIPFLFKYDDGIDVTQTQGSDYFKDAGNERPYAETDVIEANREIIEEEKEITPKKPKGIIKSISKYFTPTEKEVETTQAPIPSTQSKMSTGTKNALSLSEMENYGTEWYKSNVTNIIALQNTDGFPKGFSGEERFRTLFYNLDVPLQEIDNYLKRTNYSQRAELYKKVYAKVKANNNKLLKKQQQEK